MLRPALILVFFGLFLPLLAEDEAGPLISIVSPDTGTTFAYATIQSRALIWNKKDKMLSAEVTFTDSRQSELQPNEDTHRFRLPGVTFDEAKKVFYATSPKGEQIPVARMKKELFLSTIEVLPNAVVRVSHRRGELAVSLEAIRPDDPAMKQSSPTNADGTHGVDLNQIMQ